MELIRKISENDAKLSMREKERIFSWLLGRSGTVGEVAHSELRCWWGAALMKNSPRLLPNWKSTKRRHQAAGGGSPFTRQEGVALAPSTSQWEVSISS